MEHRGVGPIVPHYRPTGVAGLRRCSACWCNIILLEEPHVAGGVVRLADVALGDQIETGRGSGVGLERAAILYLALFSLFRHILTSDGSSVVGVHMN